jgi:hypothetical protein
MKTLLIEDLPLMEDLSESAARTIVGGRWSEANETPTRPRVLGPSGGVGYTGEMIQWELTITESGPIPCNTGNPV